MFRHAQLVLVHLISHPDARQASNRQSLAEAQREVQVSLGKLERLKPRITKRYERHLQLLRDRGDRKTTVEFPDDDQTLPAAEGALDPALAGRPQPLAAAENRDLAVKLAQTEFRRRASARSIPKGWGGHGKAGDEYCGTNTSTRLEDGKVGADADDLAVQLQDVRNNIITHQNRGKPSTTPYQAPVIINKPLEEQPALSYSYPNVPVQSKHSPDQGLPSVPVDEEKPLERTIQPPKIPAKIQEIPKISQHTTPDTPPPIPQKVPASIEFPSNKDRPASTGNPLSKDLHPSTFTFKPSSYLENGTPLRTIFISPNLRKQFLSIAGPNTLRNLETCGILCGSLISNALFISKLVIPQQESTPDTCEMVNEAAIFDYCESEDLMVLGWIHTHPTQTCFMSSRDLHTQSGYQVMLAESIAIVCAPSHNPNWGVFRLTDPPGLKTVLSCTQPGLFHPHEETHIYTDALRPGHVFEAKGLEFETVDLRSNSK